MQIEVGEVYKVNYVDLNYSYYGFATCVGVFNDGKSRLFALNTRRFLRLEERSVLEAAPDEEAIAITNERTIEYVQEVLNHA